MASATYFSDEQRAQLHRDGFLILRNAVPAAYIREVRHVVDSVIADCHQDPNIGGDLTKGPPSRSRVLLRAKHIQDLAGRECVRRLLDPLRPVIEAAFGSSLSAGSSHAQMAVRFPGDAAGMVAECGYPDEDIPHYGWMGHLDGLWNGGSGVPQATGPHAALTGDALLRWRRDPGTNGVQLFHPKQNSAISNFTALVGVALSDQSADGAGNLGVLAGAHHHMTDFFRWQRTQGEGCLGPGGAGWPREDANAPNCHGLVHIPPAVRELYMGQNDAVLSSAAPSGVWPKPTLLLLQPGDAIIVLTPNPD